MLKTYVAPNGRAYQFEEGRQPTGYRPLEAKPAPKRRAPANKSRAPKDKEA